MHTNRLSSLERQPVTKTLGSLPSFRSSKNLSLMPAKPSKSWPPTDESEKKRLYSELQKVIHDQVPDIPIYVQPNILGISNRVQGYKYFGAIAVDFWRLWLDDAKANTKP